MADVAPSLHVSEPVEVDLGGLRFSATFRAPAGATLRVSGSVDGHRVELLRFDDFVAQPHYHVPAAGDAIMLDAGTGDPLDFYLEEIRSHLGELLVRGGFGEIVPTVDLDAVSRNVDQIRRAMTDVVPDGYTRVPGVGLRRDGDRTAPS
jgi:hypothetical protein